LARLSELEQGLYEVCLDVERNVAALDEKEARLWARSDARRHSHTLAAILDHARRCGLSAVRVLNASGCDAGHQDFALSHHLRKHGPTPRWVAFESPSNPHLKSTTFQRWTRELGIDLRLCDFSKTAPGDLYGPEQGAYDVVLFTEIAEHLDHTTLLNALKAIHTRLAPSGLLILTTPNLLSLGNRLRILMGKGDGPFWNDGVADLERGTYGHIVLHSPDRLARLLGEVGFQTERLYTFSFGMEQFRTKASATQRLAHRALDLSAHLVPRAGPVIFLSASRSAERAAAKAVSVR
jgi:hypothetical protein